MLLKRSALQRQYQFKFVQGLLVPFWILIGSCGNEDKASSQDGEVGPVVPKKSPTPSAAISPTPQPDTSSREFWVTSSSSRVVSRYDAQGKIKLPLIDLKSTLGVDGGATALQMLDPNTLMLFFDPGLNNKTESLSLVDPGTTQVKSKKWFMDYTEMKNVETSSLVTGFISNTVLIPVGSKVLRLLYDSNFTPAALSTFLEPSTLPNCPFSQTKSLISAKIKGQNFLLLASSGAHLQINAIKLEAGAPSCAFSFNYEAADDLTNSGDAAVDMLVGSDGRLYVLYQNDVQSKLVSYKIESSSLSEGRIVFQDQGILGPKPKGLAARSNQRLIFSNTTDDKIYEVTTSGAFTGFFLENSFTQDVTSINTFSDKTSK